MLNSHALSAWEEDEGAPRMLLRRADRLVSSGIVLADVC